MPRGSRWLPVAPSTFRYCFVFGVCMSKASSLSDSFCDDTVRLDFSIGASALSGTSGDPMLVKTARKDSCHVDNIRKKRIALTGCVGMAIRLDIGCGNLRSLQRRLESGGVGGRPGCAKGPAGRHASLRRRDGWSVPFRLPRPSVKGSHPPLSVAAAST